MKKKFWIFIFVLMGISSVLAFFFLKLSTNPKEIADPPLDATKKSPIIDFQENTSFSWSVNELINIGDKTVLKNHYLGLSLEFPNELQARATFEKIYISSDKTQWQWLSDEEFLGVGPFFYSGVLPSSSFLTEEITIANKTNYLVHGFFNYLSFDDKEYWQGSALSMSPNPEDNLWGWRSDNSKLGIKNDSYMLIYTYADGYGGQALGKFSSSLQSQLQLLDGITKSVKFLKNKVSWERYQNLVHGYMVQYPKNWEIDVDKADIFERYGEDDLAAILTIKSDSSYWQLIINSKNEDLTKLEEFLPCPYFESKLECENYGYNIHVLKNENLEIWETQMKLLSFSHSDKGTIYALIPDTTNSDFETIDFFIRFYSPDDDLIPILFTMSKTLY